MVSTRARRSRVDFTERGSVLRGQHALICMMNDCRAKPQSSSEPLTRFWPHADYNIIFIC